MDYNQIPNEIHAKIQKIQSPLNIVHAKHNMFTAYDNQKNVYKQSDNVQ